LQQRRFATPEDAAGALVAAAQAEQSEELMRILGNDADDILSSGDEVADRQARARFLRDYDEKHALVSEPDGSVTLQVGHEDWPMPIPIVKRWNSWRFDVDRGKEEILNRRIGRNELDAQQVCLALVDAQREYISMDRNVDGVPEYAQKLISDLGQKNGLYWEAGPGEPPSPMGPLVAQAAAEGYGASRNESNHRRPYHGYYYKLLRSPGPNAPGGARDYMANGRLKEGFAVVAWPAEYGNSGLMTFLVSHHGVVYQRDLGEQTDEIAAAITAFDPDPQWKLE
jgi:hypothetical protein